MDVVERNLECIKQNNLKLYNLLMKPEKLNDTQVQAESAPARDGNKVIFIEKDHKSYHLNSTYRPVEEAKRWAQQYKTNNRNMVVSMFGLGNGLFAKELCKVLGEDGKLFILEPSPGIFYHGIQTYDMEELFTDHRVQVFVRGLNDEEYIHALEKNIHWSNLNSQVLCFHPLYDQIFSESYNNMLEIIKDNNAATMIGRNTAAFLGRQSAINTIENLTYVMESNIISDLHNKFPKSIPAIIVGAGPSLDKNIEQLKYVKGKAIIFATDTSLKYLMKNNIRPDFIVTLDPLKSLNHFNYIGWESIPLLCKYDSHPAVLKAHQGRKVFYDIGSFSENYYKSLGKCLPPYHAGGSVSTAAFFVCRYLQFEKIILIGQDLAYQGEASHAGGISFNARDTGLKTLMVEGIDGKPVKTRYDWYTFIQWFKGEIPGCREQGIEVVDATEGGAKIDGSLIMSLEEAIHRYCNEEMDIAKIMDNIPPSLNRNEKVKFNLYIKQGVENIDYIMRLSKENAEAYARLIAIMEKKISKRKEVCRDNKSNSSDNESNSSDINDRKEMKALEEKIINNNSYIEEKPIFCIIDDAIQEVTTKLLTDEEESDRSEAELQIKKYENYKMVYEEIINQSATIKSKLT